jgi:succinyl-diaminopimelate desuccinylase
MSPALLDDATLADRLAARTLELVDVPSESRAEAALFEHVAGVLRGGGLDVLDLGDACLLARPAGRRPRALLAGHLDTVPAQGNIPGSRDGERVHGLGTSDMKGGLAVMVELALAGADLGVLFFPREELPFRDTALTPLLEREPAELDAEVAFVMEPTDCAIHAGCLGNINARWAFQGRSGHSARPWLADNAIERAAAGIVALAAHPPNPVTFDGLEFVEVATVTRISGGIATNVVPDLVECHLNFRYAPGRTPDEADARLAELTAGHGELEITGHAPSGAVSATHPDVVRLIELGGLEVAPKQAWTPVAELTAAGIPAVNFGPGTPGEAHSRDESIRIDNLVRAYRVLEAYGDVGAGA